MGWFLSRLHNSRKTSLFVLLCLCWSRASPTAFPARKSCPRSLPRDKQGAPAVSWCVCRAHAVLCWDSGVSCCTQDALKLCGCPLKRHFQWSLQDLPFKGFGLQQAVTCIARGSACWAEGHPLCLPNWPLAFLVMVIPVKGERWEGCISFQMKCVWFTWIFSTLSDPPKLQIYSYSHGKFCLIFCCLQPCHNVLQSSGFVKTWAQAPWLEASSDLLIVFKWSQTQCFEWCIFMCDTWALVLSHVKIPTCISEA